MRLGCGWDAAGMRLILLKAEIYFGIFLIFAKTRSSTGRALQAKRPLVLSLQMYVVILPQLYQTNLRRYVMGQCSFC